VVYAKVQTIIATRLHSFYKSVKMHSPRVLFTFEHSDLSEFVPSSQNLFSELKFNSMLQRTPKDRHTQIMLTLNLLTTTIVASPSNASKWQMGFNSAFKGLIFMWI
jgi:hypothetical protein